MKLNYITVVFRDEIEFLKIQARSFVHYVNDVETVTIVINDEDAVADLIDTAWYGAYQDRVQIICKSKWNYISRVNGWEEQQLCKLLAGAEATTDWSVVLDAKTWFVQPLDLDRLFDSQGRARSGRVGIFHHFEESQQFVENHFGITFDQMLGPGGVPFIFHTQEVQELVASQTDFADFFQTAVRYPHLVNEFHLYAAYVLSKHKTYDVLYNPESGYSPAHCAQWGLADFDQWFRHQITNNKNYLPTASIHRKLYSQLSPEQLQFWNQFLVSKNLLDSGEFFNFAK